MLLTITTTYQPATDLGYLLHKHPAKVQEFDLAFGNAHVFYPEATEERCTAALLLDINSFELTRSRNFSGFSLDHYVNDRPYIASSFMSVAIAKVYSTALGGRCASRPVLVEQTIPLEAHISVVRSHGGEDLIHRLFSPLGYSIEVTPYLLDSQFPQWGQSNYFSLDLKQEIRLSDLLSHLYVLLPVLDNDKHYFVDRDEIEKLLRHGECWLNKHPAKELITSRYLKNQRTLKREALSRLIAEEAVGETLTENVDPKEELEEKISLHQQRHGTVLAVLKNSHVQRVLDLGCNTGKFLQVLLKEPQFTEIVGMDVSYRALERAKEYLKFDWMAPAQLERIKLLHGSLIYRDERLEGYDAAVVIEVIEHLDAPRLQAFERNLFEFMHPSLVIVTTPNGDYNSMWESLPSGKFRHPDHRFEWGREEFQIWANTVATDYGYSTRFMSIGPEDPDLGSPSQMAIFEVDTL